MINRIYKKLEHFFYRTLCIRPDWPMFGGFVIGENRGIRLTCWYYNFTGRIASYFHRKTCSNCQEKHEMRRSRNDT